MGLEMVLLWHQRVELVLLREKSKKKKRERVLLGFLEFIFSASFHFVNKDMTVFRYRYLEFHAVHFLCD